MLAADCERAWIHAGWEDTMQEWYMWLEEMKKKDEKEMNGGTASAQGDANGEECGGKCGSLAQNLQAYSMEVRSADLGK